MLRKSLETAGIVALLLTIAAPIALTDGGKGGQDWPQFRGVHRDGISPESGLAESWPESGPKEVWRVPIGQGFSAISVVGKHLYTMFSDDLDGTATEFAAAYDAGSGKELWRTPIGAKLDTEFGNGPRSTPTIDGKSVYVLGSMGDLVALSTDKGKELWRVSLTEKLGAARPNWGFCSSALVDGDHVVVESGGTEGSYAALDKKTGAVAWTYGEATAPGYNSALQVEMGGKTRYIYVTGEQLVCLDDKGGEVWTHDWPQGETHAMALFVEPDRVFAAGAEGVGAKMFRVTEKGGEANVEQLWETRFMRNHFSSSVVHDGFIFGFDNATLKAIAVEDAELAWAKRGMGKGSLILADGNLLVLSDRGRLALVEATASGYVERGSVQALEGRCWTAPTLSHGRLYLRGQEEMVAYDVTR